MMSSKGASCKSSDMIQQVMSTATTAQRTTSTETTYDKNKERQCSESNTGQQSKMNSQKQGK